MQHVVNPTFPRSGHHLLERLLRGTLGQQLVYSERYGSRNVPDPTKQLFWEKSHDYHLAEWSPERDDVTFVVQYRTCLESIVSDFEIRVVANDALNEAYRSVDAYIELDHSRESWERYAEWASDYWQSFVEKWVTPFAHHAKRNVHFLEYSQLLRDPYGEISSLLRKVGVPSDAHGRLREVIAEAEIRNRRDLRSFEFFDTPATRHAEAKVQPLLASLGLRQYTTHTGAGRRVA